MTNSIVIDIIVGFYAFFYYVVFVQATSIWIFLVFGFLKLFDFFQSNVLVLETNINK